MLKWLNQSKKTLFNKNNDDTETEFKIDDLIKALKPSKDFQRFEFKTGSTSCIISYMNTLVNPEFIHRDVLSPFNRKHLY